MQHVNELRDELSKLFIKLKDGNANLKEATEMNNAAGKIMQSLKAQLDHARLRQEKPDIAFLK